MKTLALTLGLFLIAGAAALSSASAAPQSPATGQQSEAKALNAKVVNVDAEKNVISVKDARGAELAVRVAASTKITKAGKAITIADIQTGDSIVFELDSGDQSLAKIIAVLPG
jgi:hypothetical protein